VARHRFLRSTQIAALVDRSLDRTNDRLSRLFHAGYLDRPRAQLDYYPTSGSAPMVYALADHGAQLLSELRGIEVANPEWSKKNSEAGRPFIEHQLEIMDFYVALQRAIRTRGNMQLIDADELAANVPVRGSRNPFAQRAALFHGRVEHDVGIIPDLVFGIRFTDGSRRCFMVEIDRGTMPIERADIRQTSFERKMRAYLTAYAEKQHEQRFGWKAYRVLVVTTNERRRNAMMDVSENVAVQNSPGGSLFFFATRDQLRACDPFMLRWQVTGGRSQSIV
jgi:Replication-relaxation